MKNRIKNNSIWYILTLIAFVSSVFLISEYITNKNTAIANTDKFELIQKEANFDQEKYESKDFNLIKNISDAIRNLLSIQRVLIIYF